MSHVKCFFKSTVPRRKTSKSSHPDDSVEQPSLLDTVYGKRENTNTSVANGNVATDSKKKVNVKKKKTGTDLEIEFLMSDVLLKFS